MTMHIFSISFNMMNLNEKTTANEKIKLPRWNYILIIRCKHLA